MINSHTCCRKPLIIFNLQRLLPPPSLFYLSRNSRAPSSLFARSRPPQIPFSTAAVAGRSGHLPRLRALTKIRLCVSLVLDVLSSPTHRLFDTNMPAPPRLNLAASASNAAVLLMLLVRLCSSGVLRSGRGPLPSPPWEEQRRGQADSTYS